MLNADRRRPTIALQLDIASGPGVADVLIAGLVASAEPGELIETDPRSANAMEVGSLGGYGYGYSYDYASGVKGGTPADGNPPAGGTSPNGAGAADAPVPTSQA